MDNLNFMGVPMPDPNETGDGPMFLVVTWVFTALCIVVVWLRIYVRWVGTKDCKIEDWLMLLALALHISGLGLVTAACYWGYGKDFANTTLEEFISSQRLLLFNLPFTYFVETIARLSIAIVLVRIFGVRAWFKWFMILFTVLTWLVAVPALILEFTHATPFESLWNPTIIPTSRIPQPVVARVALVFQCRNNGSIRRVHSANSRAVTVLILISDILYVVFPVAFIWKLALTTYRKFLLVLLLSVSAITAGVQATKIAIAIRGMLGLTEYRDAGYLGVVFYTVNYVEQSVVIIMGSIPSLAPIRKAQLPLFVSIGRSFNSLLSGITRGSRSISRKQSYWDLEMDPTVQPSAPSDDPGKIQSEHPYPLKVDTAPTSNSKY